MTEKLSTAAFGNKRNAKQLLIDALKHMDGADLCVLIWRSGDKLVETAWSDGNLTERVGMLEIAKVQMIENARA